VAGTDPLDTFRALFRAIIDDADVDAFMALWAVDEDVTMWGSELAERAVGHDQIRTLAEGIAGAQLAFIWDELRVHDAGDTAWINAAGSVNGMPYRLTAILVRRRAREWKWHTFNGSVPES
jgi:ketosteroid isomerase-like protein